LSSLIKSKTFSPAWAKSGLYEPNSEQTWGKLGS